MKSIFSREKWRSAISQMSNVTSLVVALAFLLFSFTSQAQNNISVSFTEGFIANYGNNTRADLAYHFASKGWTNVQFTQNSSATIFTAQGNDIPGNVLITDYLNVQRSIPGFIKWRTPSGNAVSTVVFTPTASATLATGAVTTQTISTTSYIGMTFNGQTLAFTDGTSVSGNSANTLNELNAYLASQPKFSIANSSSLRDGDL